MDRINILKFILISLALPAQYLISSYWSNDNVQQSIAINNLITQYYDFKSNYLTFDSWKKWYISLVIDEARDASADILIKRSRQKSTTTATTWHDNAEDYDVALEVLTYRKNLADFGESSVTRSPRPSRVRFRVGQVIRHKRFDLIGVIIGWDERAHAPSSWIERNYNLDEEVEKYLGQPHYLILVDEKYQEKYSSKAYIAQEDIEIIVNSQVKHRILKSYFSGFDGGQYLKKKYLNTVYPYD